ncbi:MAG: FtsX-like permease family protein [Firmicutes bacterium]|nr:FtsX-like permease family protein [Bacillota bacterium]
MNFKEFIFVALEGVRNNKLRSFLTTLGIVIGIAAVIAVIAIGEGGKAMIIGEMEKFGTNIYQIYPNYRDGEYTKPRDFTKEDVEVIKKISPEVKWLSPMKYSRGEIRSSLGKKNARIIGTTADYKLIRSVELARGRFFNEEDDAVGRRVVVLDEKLGEEIFGRDNPVGQRVMLWNSQPALVIGVIKARESQLGMEPDRMAYVPISFMEGSNQWRYVNSLIGSAASKDTVYKAMDRTKLILERRHNSPGHYDSYSMEEEMKTVNKITGIMGLIISSIAGVSLLVGGIGVMNIMLVSVTERTREIGIRMALGAKRKDILMQFLIEAVVLCSIGGVIGIILGYGGAMVVAQFLNLPPLVSWWTALGAFIFSAIIGIFFGIYPANKASKLDPIVALRRE